MDPSAKYAKRPRHKTKADKYEYKGDVEKKRSSRTPRASKRRRIKTGPLHNEDFRADNVDTERVTLKPHMNLGIFSKSKSSTPNIGRDLPDLTFPKMVCLSKSAGEADRELASLRMQYDRKRPISKTSDDTPRTSKFTDDAHHIRNNRAREQIEGLTDYDGRFGPTLVGQTSNQGHPQGDATRAMKETL